MKSKDIENIKRFNFSPEFINDFSDRVIDMIESECELLDFLQKHPLCANDNASSQEEYNQYEAVKLKHDNDFCRVREMLREIKNDKNLLCC